MVSDTQIGWIDQALAGLGRQRTGPIEIERERPWSLVAHMPTPSGRVWFKANGPAFASEAVTLERLGEIVPECVLVPIAVDAATGWFLTDDGGAVGIDPGREASENDPAVAGVPGSGVTGIEVIELYARVQMAAAPSVGVFLESGVPDRRPDRLADVFDRAVSHSQAGADAPRCAGLRPSLMDACALLDDGQITLINGDVKPSHVFVGPPTRCFDWGDVVVSHPLTSLASVTRLAAASGVAVERAVAPWGVPPDSDRARAGVALGELIGVDVWMRDMPGVFERHPGAMGRAITRLADSLERTPSVR